MKKKLFFALILTLALLACAAQADVVINEAMASSAIFVSGRHDDWIELRNTENKQVSLKGWYLSNDEFNLTRWAFPDTAKIAKNGYLVVYCAGSEEVTDGLKNGLYIFMLRQFFSSVPQSLEEAAYVDGCSVFRTFWQVLLPEAVPVIVSCLLFSFVWQWTDTFYSRLFLGGNTLLSMQVSGIADRIGNYFATQLKVATTLGRRQQFVSTATLMTIAPLLIIYLFAQRSFVESISTSGMKM